METVAKYKPNLEVVSDAEALASRTVDLFICDSKQAMSGGKPFYVAISGGNTPRRFFELLGDLPGSKALQWQNIQLFWVDERYVPADSEYSNYKLAADTFLPKVPIPPDNVHRIPTEYSDSSSASRAYEETIRGAFGLKEKELPTFDLMLLGMGPDGHTGSLFPNSYASFDKDDLACAVYVLDQKLNRVTLTHPVLCAAAHLAVLVSGEEKAKILKEVLTSSPDEVRYPIHALWPVLDKVTWLVDRQAAKLL